MKRKTDKDTFLNLIEKNKGIIYKICNSYCRNSADREDLAQEIIYQLWKSEISFNSDYKFSTWMYRVALNVAISHYRKDKKSVYLISSTEKVIDIEDKAGEDDKLEENLSRLQKYINDLKELDRALIILYLESKTHTEIAEILGISETNVSTRINRIKGKLKQKFTN